MTAARARRTTGIAPTQARTRRTRARGVVAFPITAGLSAAEARKLVRSHLALAAQLDPGGAARWKRPLRDAFHDARKLPSESMDRLDLRALLHLVKDPRAAEIARLRAQVSPGRRRPVLSLKAIARSMGIHPRHARRLHQVALDQIVAALLERKTRR
jgi:hypothetical protein